MSERVRTVLNFPYGVFDKRGEIISQHKTINAALKVFQRNSNADKVFKAANGIYSKEVK